MPLHRGPAAQLALDTHLPAQHQALLAGFAWYGLTEVPFDLEANVVRARALFCGGSGQLALSRAPHPCSVPCVSQVIQTLYLVVTTLIMGLELLTVVNATLCAILGPGLALRGPDGSMHNAVNGMMTHYKFTFACFTCGLLCFHISALLYAWMQFEWELARHPAPCTPHPAPPRITPHYTTLHRTTPHYTALHRTRHAATTPPPHCQIVTLPHHPPPYLSRRCQYQYCFSTSSGQCAWPLCVPRHITPTRAPPSPTRMPYL